MRVKTLLIALAASMALLAGCTPGSPLSLGNEELTSNGVESLSPEEIMDKALVALGGAESFRAAGTFGSGLFAMTANLVYAGDGFKGNGNFLGVEANIVLVAGELYVNADPSFYATMVPEEQQHLLTDIADKWVSLPAAWITFLVPLPLTVANIAAEFDPAAPLTKGETSTVGGTPVIRITDAGGTVFSVATVGEPYLLKVEYSNSTGLAFTEFNEPATVEAPEEAISLTEWLNLDDLNF